MDRIFDACSREQSLDIGARINAVAMESNIPRVPLDFPLQLGQIVRPIQVYGQEISAHRAPQRWIFLNEAIHRIEGSDAKGSQLLDGRNRHIPTYDGRNSTFITLYMAVGSH